jgi:hypothetical protein
LESFLDESIKYNQELKFFRELCERVSGYYFTQRHPIMDYTGITWEDIQQNKQETQQINKTLTKGEQSTNMSKNQTSQ